MLLGIQLTDPAAQAEMVLRCRRAVSLYEGAGGATIIACGGAVGGESSAEAYEMRAQLIELGIPERDIICEDKSRTTMENFVNGLALPAARAETPLVAVTSDYHAARARMIARRLQRAVRVEAVSTPLSLRKLKKATMEPLFMLDILMGFEDPGVVRPAWTRVVMRLFRQDKP